MPLDPKTGKLKHYRHKALQTARGSPITPSMGGAQRLIGTVQLSRKEQGEVGQPSDKPAPTIKGRPSTRKY